MLRIGNVTLKTNLLLAPIAGYCDLAFRLVVRSVPEALPGVGSVGLACTDLLCPQAVLSENEKSLWLAATCPEDQPICMQLYGADALIMAEAARWAEAHGATTIDINMGCPVDKVTKKNGGSKLLCDPRLALDIAQSVVRAVNLPVTAKIRLGWDDGSFITDTLPGALADVGISAVTVHGRTTEQKFRGSVRLGGIARVVQSMNRHHPGVPVIGNGDVKSPMDAKRMIDVTGCAGVMIGRGALGQPWIFRDCAAYLATGQLPPPLSREEKARCVLAHFENLLRLRDERIALNTIRTRMSWYSAHLQPWSGLRHRVQSIKTAAEFRDFMHEGIAAEPLGV
ncbi:MAG: tRNA dihydrouridine synthase DusB [Phycisphaera sp.]|nr:tRNA dihydrouridine synthase DusB [Phycisphaera sp.]